MTALLSLADRQDGQGTHGKGDAVQSRRRTPYQGRTDIGSELDTQHIEKQRVLAEDWQLSQCLFGEHLLKTHPDKVVVLVESEKSAVIGSAIFPDYVWLATGGKSQMREEKLRVLSGRTVLLFPDADAYAEWKQRAESMYFCKVVVSTSSKGMPPRNKRSPYRHS